MSFAFKSEIQTLIDKGVEGMFSENPELQYDYITATMVVNELGLSHAFPPPDEFELSELKSVRELLGYFLLEQSRCQFLACYITLLKKQH